MWQFDSFVAVFAAVTVAAMLAVLWQFWQLGLLLQCIAVVFAADLYVSSGRSGRSGSGGLINES